MGTCRFLVTNLAESATLKNGSSGSPTPPVRSEVAPFTMERALNSDRRSVWKAGATNAIIGTGWQMDIDLGSAKLVNGIYVGGLSCPGGSITSITVGYIDAYPGGTYWIFGTAPFDKRDGGFVVSPGWTARYWFIYVQATAAPVIGRVVLGQFVDLGVAPNPGATSSPFRNRVEQVYEDGSVNVNELGYNGREFSMSFDPILVGTADLVESLADYPGTLIYVDPRDRFFEVFVRQGKAGISRQAANLFSGQLEMARNP